MDKSERASGADLGGQFFNWIRRTFPGNHTLANGALPAVPSYYMALCLRLHIPKDADLVILEVRPAGRGRLGQRGHPPSTPSRLPAAVGHPSSSAGIHHLSSGSGPPAAGALSQNAGAPCSRQPCCLGCMPQACIPAPGLCSPASGLCCPALPTVFQSAVGAAHLLVVAVVQYNINDGAVNITHPNRRAYGQCWLFAGRSPACWPG